MNIDLYRFIEVLESFAVIIAAFYTIKSLYEWRNEYASTKKMEFGLELYETVLELQKVFDWIRSPGGYAKEYAKPEYSNFSNNEKLIYVTVDRIKDNYSVLLDFKKNKTKAIIYFGQEIKNAFDLTDNAFSKIEIECSILLAQTQSPGWDLVCSDPNWSSIIKTSANDQLKQDISKAVNIIESNCVINARNFFSEQG